MIFQGSDEQLSNDKLIEWYSEYIPLMKQNLNLYQNEIKRIDTKLAEYERLGEYSNGTYIYKTSFINRKQFIKDLEGILFPYNHKSTIREEYTRRISRLTQLIKICEAYRHRNDSEAHFAQMEAFRGITARSVLTNYGVEIHDKFACCPIHHEKHPSLCLYDSTNSWYCFGCNKGGNAIDLVMYIENKPFKEIIPILKTLV